MGRRVDGSNGSMGQRVTFTILYLIADDAMLTPPHCKKHTPYDVTRLTPHCCKKHTASFAHSTGKFPSVPKWNEQHVVLEEAFLRQTCHKGCKIVIHRLSPSLYMATCLIITWSPPGSHCRRDIVGLRQLREPGKKYKDYSIWVHYGHVFYIWGQYQTFYPLL